VFAKSDEKNKSAREYPAHCALVYKLCIRSQRRTLSPQLELVTVVSSKTDTATAPKQEDETKSTTRACVVTSSTITSTAEWRLQQLAAVTR